MACSVLHDGTCTCSYSAPAASSGDVVAASSGDLAASSGDLAASSVIWRRPSWTLGWPWRECSNAREDLADFLADIFMVPPIAQATIVLNTFRQQSCGYLITMNLKESLNKDSSNIQAIANTFYIGPQYLPVCLGESSRVRCTYTVSWISS